MLTIEILFLKNIRTLLFQEKALANQILQIFNKTMPSHSYSVVVLCHFHRERFLTPNPLMEFFFHEKPKNVVAESCLNGSAYCANLLTWASDGGDFWGLGSFFFPLLNQLLERVELSWTVQDEIQDLMCIDHVAISSFPPSYSIAALK